MVEWNLTALNTAAVSTGVREGHEVALAEAAVFDAVNSISRRYTPIHTGCVQARRPSASVTVTRQYGDRNFARSSTASRSKIGPPSAASDRQPWIPVSVTARASLHETCT